MADALLSDILVYDVEGVKWAKLQRWIRAAVDAAGITYSLGGLLTDIEPRETEGVKWAKLQRWTRLLAEGLTTGGSGSGVFFGPASSTDNAVVRFDGTGGNRGQNSGVTIDDSGNMTINGALFMLGATGGMPTQGVINARGLKIDGVDVSTSSSSYWIADAPGIKYTAGPVSLLGTPTGVSGDFQLNNITATGYGAFNVPVGSAAFTPLEADSTISTSPRGIMSAQFTTDIQGARLHLRKARGTRNIPTTVVTGDHLGRVVGSGYDGANYLEMASIQFAAEQTVAATRLPTSIQFFTGTNAAPSVLTLAATIDSSQVLTLAAGLKGTTGTFSSLTATRVPFAGTAGLLSDAATLTFNSGTGALSATSFIGDGTAITGLVTSITGTAGQITRSAATGAVTLSLPTAITGINSFTSATGQTLTLATLDGNANLLLSPNGTGATVITGTRSLAFGLTSLVSIKASADAANANIVLTPNGTGAVNIGRNGTFTTVSLGWTATEGLFYSASNGGSVFVTTGGFGNSWGSDGNTGAWYNVADNTGSIGKSGNRASSGFFGPTGLRIGNGTNGPTITATGTSPNESLVITYAGTGSTLLAGTNTLKFGATAAATIATTLDTTAGVMTFTAPSAGSVNFVTSATGMRFSGYGAGALATDASGNVTATSDARYKTGIRAFTRGLAEVLALKPVTYKWTKESGLETEHEYSGFVAQDVQKVVPEAVFDAVDGTLSFSDRPITASLVNAIKELTARLTALESHG